MGEAIWRVRGRCVDGKTRLPVLKVSGDCLEGVRRLS